MNNCIDCEKDTILKYSDLRIKYNKLENYSKILEKCLDVKEVLNEYLRSENETLKNKLRSYEME